MPISPLSNASYITLFTCAKIDLCTQMFYSFKIRSKLEIYVRSAGHEATESVVTLHFETIMDTSFTGILFL